MSGGKLRIERDPGGMPLQQDHVKGDHFKRDSVGKLKMSQKIYRLVDSSKKGQMRWVGTK